VKSQFIVFARVLKKEQWIPENDRSGVLCEIGFDQGPQKLNNGSVKTIHLGLMDNVFTVIATLE
jgi:hypothetical protein